MVQSRCAREMFSLNVIQVDHLYWLTKYKHIAHKMASSTKVSQRNYAISASVQCNKMNQFHLNLNGLNRKFFFLILIKQDRSIGRYQSMSCRFYDRIFINISSSSADV